MNYGTTIQFAPDVHVYELAVTRALQKALHALDAQQYTRLDSLERCVFLGTHSSGGFVLLMVYVNATLGVYTQQMLFTEEFIRAAEREGRDILDAQ